MKNFLQSQIIIVNFLLSSIINTLADFMNCTTVNKEEFNVSYLAVKCTHNDEYLFWITFFILPSFFFYACLLPITAFVYMYKNRMRLFELDVVSKISFLLKGYQRESYYWLLFIFNYELYFIIKTLLGNFFPPKNINDYGNFFCQNRRQ